MKSDKLREGAVEVAKVLRSHGFEAWFAGGCVRDQLLGVPPKDWDIATDAPPDVVQQLFPKTVAVGAAFGVVEVIWSGKRTYEVATFRADGTYSDGRRPDEVRYSTSPEEDVLRRDFTINALLMDPIDGSIRDYVGGQVDLGARLIRAVGDPQCRFREDRLRMLRAVRFASRLQFSVEVDTWSAIIAEAQFLSVVSPERITRELEAMFTSVHVGCAMELLIESGLGEVCLPARWSEAALQGLRRLGPRPPDLHRVAIAWALVHDGYSDREVDTELRRRKLSRKVIREVQRLIRLRLDAEKSGDGEPPAVELLRSAQSPEADTNEVYLESRFGVDGEPSVRFRAARTFLNQYPPSAEAILTGADLQALGMQPGPHFKTLLASIEGAVLQGKVHSRTEAIEWVKNRAGPLSTKGE